MQSVSAKSTFIRFYQTAQGNKEAPQSLIKAACLYVLELKAAGLDLDAITRKVIDAMRSAGGQTPETARLDADILMHCVEQFHKPSPAPHPKPPDFIG